MRTFYAYPAVLEPGTEPGTIVVTFPDVPEAISQGRGRSDAVGMGSDALGVALLGILEARRPLPSPSVPTKDQVVISVAPELAAKIAVIEAFCAAAITQQDFATRLGKDVKEARRILDPDHATKLPTLVEALSVLGRRLVVGVEAA